MAWATSTIPSSILGLTQLFFLINSPSDEESNGIWDIGLPLTVHHLFPLKAGNSNFKNIKAKLSREQRGCVFLHMLRVFMSSFKKYMGSLIFCFTSGGQIHQKLTFLNKIFTYVHILQFFTF